MLTEIEKEIIAAVQGDLPIVPCPYRDLAAQVGISEAAFMETLQQLCDRGVIRRFGATLRHQRSGFEANVMVAWVVDEDRIEEVGRKMAAFKQVSHCYRRDPNGDWPYNLYTMVHAVDRPTCREIARKMSASTGVGDYALLFSQKELKKTSMTYFPDE
jgi:DNA-binding Lrp family transcriptional regulator